MSEDLLHIANQPLSSRLLMGTGKFSSPEIMKAAIEASESKIITTALRRVDVNDPKDAFTTIINPKDYIFMPNTSGARTAEEVIHLAKICQFAGYSDWIKLEVTPEPNHLLPDPIETLKAAEELVKMGFKVLPYIQADPILAKRLEEVGCVSVMPLGSPIGSNQGLRTKQFIALIIKQSTVPVIVDAGIGAPSHAMEAMEMGADAVLVNTAIATAADPVLMATAFKEAVITGRKAFLAGQAPIKESAMASSPLAGFLS